MGNVGSRHTAGGQLVVLQASGPWVHYVASMTTMCGNRCAGLEFPPLLPQGGIPGLHGTPAQ